MIHRENRKVSITITFMDYLLKYFHGLAKSVENQTYQNIEIIIIDKTSKMTINDYVSNSRYKNIYKIIKYNKSAGFAESYNKAIHESSGEYIFVLNPDTKLKPDCLERLVEAINLDNSIGMVSPKILRMDKNQNIYEPKIIDSTGIYLKRIMRHFDRGAGEIDKGQYNQRCYIFGATGAGALFRKSCLEDIKFNNQYFDEHFWFSREDADISWRLQNYGWKCFYTPYAVMYHVRTLKPGKRSSNPPLINMHSVKNRYLLMINNLSFKNYMINFPFIFTRDLIVVLGVILRERTSISAFQFLIKNLKRLIRKRKVIQLKVKKDVSNYWFKQKAVSFSKSEKELKKQHERNP